MGPGADISSNRPRALAKESDLIYYLVSRFWNRKSGVWISMLLGVMYSACPMLSCTVLITIKTRQDETAITANQIA